MRDYGLVSVITPSYNTADFIEETIASVVSQTYTNWELLIVDDCSTDETDTVVTRFLEDNRIKYLKNPKNSGAACSRNYALREAKGKWVAFLDSDDLWHPQKLEKQLCFMTNHGCHFSYTVYEEMDLQSRSTGVLVAGPMRINKLGMYRYCWPGCLTVMYDAEYVGLIQIADIRKNNDYAMWLRVCQKTDCFLLEECLAKYRRGREGSISTHGIFTMIKWHYKLFRDAECKSAAAAFFCTVRNLGFGTWKKIRYIKKYNRGSAVYGKKFSDL